MSSTWKGVEGRLCLHFIKKAIRDEAVEWLKSMRDSARAKKEGSLGNDCKYALTEPFSVSVKHGKQIPAATIEKWLQEAEFAAPEGSLPVLVLHPPRYKDGKSLVVCRLEDFEEFFV